MEVTDTHPVAAKWNTFPVNVMLANKESNHLTIEFLNKQDFPPNLKGGDVGYFLSIAPSSE